MNLQIRTPDGREYIPLNQQSEFHASPATFRSLVGGFGCIAAETIIGGVPIAERRAPGTVETMFGRAEATSGFCKGRAALYRVETQSGRVVVVTAEHRFLTQSGWRPLEALGVGDLVAADAGWNDETGIQSERGFSSHCSSGLRQGDGLSTPEELAARDIWRQLRRIGGGDSAKGLPFYPSVGEAGEVVSFYPAACRLDSLRGAAGHAFDVVCQPS